MRRLNDINTFIHLCIFKMFAFSIFIMATYRIKTFVILSVSLIFHISAISQTVSGNLIFHTTQGQKINVHGGTISVNGKGLYKFEEDGIIYSSKRNKIIESGGTVFLFLEVDGNPNLDRLFVFKISTNRVDSITNTISSELKDLDGDSYMEFGGSDLTEVHPSKDSMYYIPSDYYKIREGKIIYDSALTKIIDIRVNGIYLLNPGDANGYCCKVIPKPKNKKASNSGNSANLENKIVDTIANLKEVKERANYVEDQTNGKRHMHIAIWGRPTRATPYYLVKVMEDNGDAYVTHFNFFVYPKTMTIKYLDTMTDEVLDLGAWRKRKNN